MTYKINKTDGSLLTEIIDSAIDTTATDLALIGKNVTGFGEYLNENFVKLLEAFSISKLLKNNLDIYCFGGGDFTTKELDIIKSLEIDQSQIKYFSGDDRKLNYLYSKAHAFVFPSLYEGFGLPLLEAMNMGCPVVCSNTSSFPEVVNDSALLFNPESKEDIKIKLEEIFKNVNLKQRLIEKGYNNLKRFSWKKCSEESLNVYKI